MFAPENAIMVSQKMPDVLSYDKEAFFLDSVIQKIFSFQQNMAYFPVAL